MAKIRVVLIRCIGAIIAIGGGMAILGQAGAMSASPQPGQRPDIVTIDIFPGLSAKDEMPPVQFVHGPHNQAVNQDCTVCHRPKDGALSFLFKRGEKLASGSGKDFYHKQCIACHVDRKAAGQKTGPQIGQCRLCHKTRNLWVPDRQPVKFDISLHYLHEDVVAIPPQAGDSQTNCRVCHHKYNQQTGHLYYEEGTEAVCRSCHKAQKKGGVRSLRQASHASCVACHQKLMSQKIGSGPVTCAACHGSAAD